MNYSQAGTVEKVPGNSVFIKLIGPVNNGVSVKAPHSLLCGCHLLNLLNIYIKNPIYPLKMKLYNQNISKYEGIPPIKIGVGNKIITKLTSFL